MKVLEEILAAIVVLALMYGGALLILSLEPKIAAPQAPAITGNGYSAFSLPFTPSQPAVLLSMPIPYTATVTQSGPGIAAPRTRYYAPKDKR